MGSNWQQQPTDEPLLAAAGHEACLLGNEAIVRGALEAGVVFATGYPGTPSSEITDSFARLSKDDGLLFEYAVNEKIALELAFAASLAGGRSIAAMKHLGLMVAGDPLSTIPYIGTEAGMVVVSAGDPSCHTSPNEQDQRHLGPMLHLPILDPTDPTDALEMTRFGFELSERARLPVLLRTTTRVAHGRATMSLGPLRERTVTAFQRQPARYVPIPRNARRMRLEIEGRMERALELVEGSAFLRQHGDGPVAVVAQGAPAAICRELLEEPPFAGQVSLFSVGVAHPLPEKFLARALRSASRVLVVEELSPYLENALFALSARLRINVEILGKLSGHLPMAFEYEPAHVGAALRAACGLPEQPAKKVVSLNVEARPPSLCPGCPHRASFVAARAAFDESQLYFNDIGCYTLGYAPPHNVADALVCMGAGFTLAAGVARVSGTRTVGFMGDSTFFHAGMPALLDALKENASVVAVILDNQVTAMTGFQESAAQEITSPASIEEVVRGLGAKQVRVVDPYDLGETIAGFRAAREEEGVSVIIARRACPVYDARLLGRAARPPPHEVDADACRSCGRSSHGMRCAQTMTDGFERNLARARAIREREHSFDVAPCAERCPLSLCIQGYAGHVVAGELPEALGHILARTPLPESVCRVCDRPCEVGCVRNAIDETVGINDLKRYVVDWASRERPELFATECEARHGSRVAVVGAGPAGLSATQELCRRGYRVTLIEAADRAGGLLSRGIPSYRLPPDAVARDLSRLLELDVELRTNTRLGLDVTLDALLSEGHDAVVVCVGADRGRSLTLPGEGPRRAVALEYLREHADGKGAELAAENVVVIGGGNAAVDAARTALRSGARSVQLACLEARAEMPALPDEVVAAQREGVRIVNEVRPLRTETGRVIVESLAEPTRETALAAELLLFAVGQEPVLDALSVDGRPLRRTEAGLLQVDPETLATSDPRIFAAGDVTEGRRMVTAAMGYGLRAAWGIDRQIRGAKIADRRMPPPPVKTGRPAAPPTGGPRAARNHPQHMSPAESAKTFSETAGVLDAAAAYREAHRCLQCGQCGNCRACIDTLACPALTEQGGVVDIEPSLCIACGVCELVCSNQAITPGGPS